MLTTRQGKSSPDRIHIAHGTTCSTHRAHSEFVCLRGGEGCGRDWGFNRVQRIHNTQGRERHSRIDGTVSEIVLHVYLDVRVASPTHLVRCSRSGNCVSNAAAFVPLSLAAPQRDRNRCSRARRTGSKCSPRLCELPLGPALHQQLYAS